MSWHHVYGTIVTLPYRHPPHPQPGHNQTTARFLFGEQIAVFHFLYALTVHVQREWKLSHTLVQLDQCGSE